MRRSLRTSPALATAAATLVALGAALAARPPARPPVSTGPDPVVQVVESGFGRASFQVADLTGDGSAELILVGDDGRVAVYDHQPAAERAEEAPLVTHVAGEGLRIEEPEHALIALAPLLARGGAAPGEPEEPGGLDLVTLGPRGLSARAFGPDGRPGPSVGISRTLRFRIRTGRPTFTPFVIDVNRDGLRDVVVPAGDTCELWLNEGLEPEEPAGAPSGASADAPRAPAFRRAASISVELERWGNRDPEALSYVLESSFSIPGLQTRDVNGDGRPDLLVVEGRQRSFHLQDEDGDYPPRADVTLDLAIFRDTDFDGGVKPGQPLVVQAGANFEIRDLDDDGIPDYVIAHGRKVWVFLGSAAGPQFSKPASILRSAEDVTALTVLELDDDGRADLLLIKIQVPTVASLIRGLVSEWDVRISAAGYRNDGGGSFATRPGWKSELTVRLPSILGILRDPAEIVRRFEDVESRFRVSTWADVDGDGSRDLVLVSEDETLVEIWRGRGDRDHRLDAEGVLRELLFEQPERVYDLERAVLWLGSLADRRIAALTEGRSPDHRIALRPADQARLVDLQAGDFEGGGAELLAVGYQSLDDGRLIVDLVRP